MYLKSLQLLGFKSFAEKTELEFLPGVTAIVGPNGCGKSNVSDAIRWVLGEQSAKALRGSEMADVIFNGTDGRKAIGMAEVSMTFADVDAKLLSLPGVNLDFNEVTITRRVHRDGQGDYFINKTPCRLRDIQNLFMDTGIGRSSYSLMAQGQIDQILSAHPEDRRMIFEEAAGINKYKHQKKEALRKLEYTEANLVRLTDIIKEVKRQIISLQRQAGKARRYKELFDQLKALDTRLSRHKHDLLHAEVANLETQIASFTAQASQFTGQIAEKEQQVADLRRSLADIERAISGTVGRDHELKGEADRHQLRIATNNERIAEHNQLIENHRREITQSEEKIRMREQELERINGEFGQIDTALATEQTKLQTQQAALRIVEAELAGKTAELEQAKSAVFDLESQLVRGRNELQALDHRSKQDVLRSARLSTERQQFEDHRRTVAQRMEQFTLSLGQMQTGLADLRRALEEKNASATALAQELAEITRQQQGGDTELSQNRGRLDVLRQLFAAPDGRTTLANILEIEAGYGAAIEAALNHNLRTILADDLNAARTLLSGNHAVAAPELMPVASQGGNDLSAATVVKVKDSRFEPLVHSLLANVLIADNLDAAVALRKPGVAVATRQGEFVDAHGILSAVAHSHMAEIGALAEDVLRLEQAGAELAACRTDLEQRKTQTDQEWTRLRADLHAKEVEQAGKSAESNILETEHRDLESKIHAVIFELGNIEQQNAEQKQQREQVLMALKAAEAREGEVRGQITVAQQAVDELTSRKRSVTDQVTELRVTVGGWQHRRDSMLAQRESIGAGVHDLRERMETCANEITTSTGRIEQMRAEIAESEAKIAEIGVTRQGVQQQLDGFNHQRGEVATGIEHAEGELKALRQQAADAQQQKGGLEVSVAQKRMELQNLKDRVWQKYQVNIEEVHTDRIKITVADQGPVVSEEVALPTDWEAIEQQVAEMQSKLDAMGPVNVEAIHEFEELEQRHTHLTQQHEDLVNAKEQLLQIIAKINTTTRQLFSETFEKVRENFQTMFTELFGGGKANLILVDETDPLESGIEIVAKPPGKQLQSITLLSGGEKTLTATALLFSIYMVKPSPFCVLDELDAPLDESNINRFVRILARFVTQSQFVIITHNKRTIGMADALYGITMEEHGVSKVVSVKFSPREETERRQLEKTREQQEDRIDGAAVAKDDVRPHEEDLRNDLLVEKEARVAAISDTTPVVSEVARPTISAAVAPIADEVQAAVAVVVAVNESVKDAVPELAPEPKPTTEQPTA